MRVAPVILALRAMALVLGLLGAVLALDGLSADPLAPKGFAFGVAHYNEVHGAAVEVLGWDPADREGGLFTGNFDSTDDGRKKLEPIKLRGFMAYDEKAMLELGKWLGL